MGISFSRSWTRFQGFPKMPDEPYFRTSSVELLRPRCQPAVTAAGRHSGAETVPRPAAGGDGPLPGSGLVAPGRRLRTPSLPPRRDVVYTGVTRLAAMRVRRVVRINSPRSCTP